MNPGLRVGLTEAGLTGTSSANPKNLLSLLNLLGLVLLGGLPFLSRSMPGGRPNPLPPLDISFNSAKMSSNSSTFLLSKDSLSIPVENTFPPSAFFSICAEIVSVLFVLIFGSLSEVSSVPVINSLVFLIFSALSAAAFSTLTCAFRLSTVSLDAGFVPKSFSALKALDAFSFLRSTSNIFWNIAPPIV